mgnify:CR=1 FL=1
MKNNKFVINKRVFIMLFVIVLETFFIKLVQFKILPAKYFYDSSRILDLTNGMASVTDKSYSFAANFFKKINIFNFNTLNQWSYFIAFISVVLIVEVLSKNKKISYKNLLFVIASVALLNIYVFNISKDYIQFLFFLLIFIILKSNKILNKNKLILCSLLLLFEAYSFRIYYGIMMMLMITIYFIYEKLIKGKKMNKKTISKILVLALFMFFTEVFIAQLISTDNYNAISNARYIANVSRESSPDAVTIINDVFGRNTTFIRFMLNYIINLVRMLLPIELMTKGFKYVPFIFYQLFITYTVFKTSTKLSDKNVMWLITVISFIMISVIFEPDFGSFIRHESTLFLILFEMNKINEKCKEKVEK